MVRCFFRPWMSLIDVATNVNVANAPAMINELVKSPDDT